MVEGLYYVDIIQMEIFTKASEQLNDQAHGEGFFFRAADQTRNGIRAFGIKVRWYKSGKMNEQRYKRNLIRGLRNRGFSNWDICSHDMRSDIQMGPDIKFKF